MTWEDSFKVIIAALGAVGGSALIILGLSSWLGKVWANRILEKDKFKYAQELESLRSATQNFHSSLSLTNATYFETKKAYAEKRVVAIAEVWKSFVEFREKYPPEIFWLDILVKEEYGEFYTNPKFTNFKNGTDLGVISDIMPKELDLSRPFMDDITYQLFGTYTGTVARLCFYLNKCCSGNTPEYDWRNDDGVVRILSAGLSDVEFQQFQNEKWSVQILLNFLQFRISNHLKSIATGADLAKEAMDHAVEFSKVVTAIRDDETLKKANKALHRTSQ
ncbi:hypothetical protein JYB88_08420 [Shewanella cyperi]|uniref:Uncharacterized protein n=1 Tax=Shewanella cyperi TaxID=2814292 RepID=A0A975AMS6_9GAMM|nr:hypothetical protein [Shewanella cyperi]QSX31623.1 hypothetical protein JYB88_08420 [Shewanella cyperi]